MGIHPNKTALAQLPSWPLVDAQLAGEIDSARAWLVRARAAGDAAWAVAVVAQQSTTTSDPDDHRTGKIWAVAIARPPDCDGAIASRAIVLHGAGLGVLDELADALAAGDAPYAVFHGAQAALGRLAGHLDREIVPARLGCTHVAAVLLAEGDHTHDAAALSPVVAVHLGHAIGSVSPGLFEQGTDALRQIAALADVLHPLAARLVPLLRERQMLPAYTLECRLVSAVVAMERAGMPMDAAAFERVAAAWRAERIGASEPARVARLDKLISTYAHWGRDFVRRNRIHCRLHPLAADSGRFSCTDPNLQQVPSEQTAPGLRACFRAPAGKRLVIADYAQIELRVAAALAPCDALARVFREGRDAHLATAATLTGKPESNVTAHERKLAKAVNFGFLFGMGADRFREYAASGYGVELDVREARRARDAFFATFPGIAAWHRRTAALCRSEGEVVVRTALGRRKRFAPGRASVPAALNIPVQGTAAEGFKRALVALHSELPRHGARAVMCVHDEVLVEAPEAGAEGVCAAVIEAMRDAMSTVVTRIPIEVSARIAEDWGTH